MVRLAPGTTLTGGQPRLTSRLGPLSDGQGFEACRGGQEVCVVKR